MRTLAFTVSFFVIACASVVPDWNTRKIDKSSNKPRVQVVVSPLGPKVCCRGQDSRGIHRTRINVVVSQHNQEYEGVAIMDNNTGARFLPAQSISVYYYAGVGEHVLRIATYKVNEDNSVGEITWQTARKFTVVHCHDLQSDQRIAR